MYDHLIQRGTVVDGSGQAPTVADVAIVGDRIVAVAPQLGGTARQVWSARGKLVTPGFIDVHTHYDGQVTWDDAVLPSAAHGVTTIVFGNCGVGFAPVRPGTETWLIGLMEGVEDIPGTALHEGIRWSWETFPQFLDALDQRHYALDIAAQVPHGAVRAYVMGERGTADEPATAEDLDEMSALVRDAIEAGAVGFGSSRTTVHVAANGGPVPGTSATEHELVAIGRAMRDAGGGVFQVVSAGLFGAGEVNDRRERWTAVEELHMLRRFCEATQQPVSFTVAQRNRQPEIFDEMMTAAEPMLAEYPMRAQFSGRSGGLITGLQTYHALQARPTFRSLASLPLAERVGRLRLPETRSAILAEADRTVEYPSIADGLHRFLDGLLDTTFPIGDRPDYEPPPCRSVAAIAREAGLNPHELLYDAMLANEGRAMFVAFTSNYASGDLQVVHDLMLLPGTILGLGDGGAHVRFICDASIPSFMLAHWCRDRTRGPRLPIELVVRKLTSEPAELYGFTDRGRIEAGKRADLNVIDLEQITIGEPYLVGDLPGGAQRLLQDAVGYNLTMVRGVVTRRESHDTGTRPGRLARRITNPLTGSQ